MPDVQLLFHKLLVLPRCGNFKIFLSLRFYVKSFLENLEAMKVQLLAIVRALNCIYLVERVQKVQKFIKIKIQSL